MPKAMTKATFSDLETALGLLAEAAEAVAALGQPRPIVTGGALTALLSGGRIMSGDIDIVTSNAAASLLETELLKRGFVRPSGPNSLRKGWGVLHPELGIGVEVVGSRLMDGLGTTQEVDLGNGRTLRILSLEDLIADRIGQAYMLGSWPPTTVNELSRLEQAALIWYAFQDELDHARLDRRILEETGDVDLNRFQAWLKTGATGR